MTTKLLTPRDVAEQLGLASPAAARVYMLRMPHHRIGKHLRVTEQALRAFLAKTEEKPNEVRDRPTRRLSEACPWGVRSLPTPATKTTDVPRIRPTQARRMRATTA